MECPNCGNVTNLMGSESIGHSVRRVRKCPNCSHKFLTYEVPEKDVPDAESFVENGRQR